MDTKTINPRMFLAEFNTILSIFTNDLVLYKTKHGIHFISFTLLDNIHIAQARALRITNLLKETQDYFPYYRRDLTLRICGKWKKKRLSKKFKTISKKPKFLGFFYLPEKDCIISKTHLEFYFKWMNLPKKVYDYYIENCELKGYNIKMSHYRTGD